MLWFSVLLFLYSFQLSRPFIFLARRQVNKSPLLNRAVNFYNYHYRVRDVATLELYGRKKKRTKLRRGINIVNTDETSYIQKVQEQEDIEEQEEKKSENNYYAIISEVNDLIVIPSLEEDPLQGVSTASVDTEKTSTKNSIKNRKIDQLIQNQVVQDIGKNTGYDRNSSFAGDETKSLLNSIYKQENEADSNSNSIANSLKNAFSALLIADFFVVIGFLLWFLAAAALQSTYPVVLEKFQDIFQPVVVPSLTVLMVGSIASGAIDERKK